MTAHESFKRRIRARMVDTGERYGAARRALLTRATSPTESAWVSSPEMSDDAVRDATGRGWEDWVAVLDQIVGADHTALARHLVDVEGVDSWWAQTVVVGYERIRGLRLPYQMADGTFSVGRTKTIRVDAAGLRSLLLDGDGRAVLFAGMETVLRSRPGSRNVRLGLEEGSVEISMADAAAGRTRIVVAHTKLPSPENVEIWRAFWGDWLTALDETT